MAALVEWHTVGQIFVESVGAGVVIVGAFAYGARQVALVSNERVSGRPPTLRYVLAGLCFAVALAAVAYGIYFTVDK